MNAVQKNRAKEHEDATHVEIADPARADERKDCHNDARGGQPDYTSE
eukprot:CAMPEP_0185616942 /NCGR_PEP_ID=MMETSP0436-20130131/41762_1 /TAXON_ID=626734 ORGANISM="Favella taraikaensis, Strain Fe Narragansett Bay" /NCGR_SAMPLE_ID=MMETSP0436 /ASSEMBLY_ACC=CAM_ASM_000390 /LENGTH=46 /DNA_ID= /DNA_START= /DNA_END= /DNA_ORIENTATION=